MLLFPLLCDAAVVPPPAETVLPAMAYGPSCWSGITLKNLGDRLVVADIEGHRASGELVPLDGRDEMTIRLATGEQASIRLRIEEETTEAWVKVRERIPITGMQPVLAVSGTTECVAGNELRTARREVAYPMRSPWFSGDVSESKPGEVITVINTSARPTKASACYSTGSFYSVPDQREADLKPVCSTTASVLIPPYGSKEFPVEREGNLHFSLKTEGDAIVLQMLRPIDTKVKIYSVDSTVTFGSEAHP